MWSLRWKLLTCILASSTSHTQTTCSTVKVHAFDDSWTPSLSTLPVTTAVDKQSVNVVVMPPADRHWTPGQWDRGQRPAANYDPPTSTTQTPFSLPPSISNISWLWSVNHGRSLSSYIYRDMCVVRLIATLAAPPPSSCVIHIGCDAMRWVALRCHVVPRGDTTCSYMLQYAALRRNMPLRVTNATRPKIQFAYDVRDD